MYFSEFSQFARGFQIFSDKIQSNRTYGQFIAFIAVCVVKLSAVSSIVSTARSNFCLLLRFSTFPIFPLSLMQYEFYTEKNCYPNATFPQQSNAMQPNYQQTVDDCDYNAAMNVSVDWERENNEQKTSIANARE